MLNLKILYKTDPRIHFCPDCKKQGGLKKSRSRNFYEKFVKFLTPFSMYRCQLCGWRGFKSGYLIKAASFKSLFIYFFLFAITIMVVSFILKRFIIK
ncbi:MAG: hypothetical protein C4543_06860 [Ignavibacteriales bacterium]|jgi:predicted RNA-binding Zn-ribbon protein involved in translation (DUF1610 family)|nr:MAG: hypothetical protein C4543_06860 [Ignavibacteriales bacterium]